MSTHADIERMLAVYRSLDELQRRDLDAHVKVCSTCSDRWAVYELIDEQLAGLASPAPRSLAAIRAEVLRGPYLERLAPERAIGHFFRQLMLPAGVLLILIVAVWLLLQLTAPMNGSVAETPSVTPSATPVVFASPQPTPIALVALRPVGHPARAVHGEPNDGQVGRHQDAQLTPVALRTVVSSTPGLCCMSR